MTVSQLRTQLARLPDEAPILCVAANFGEGSDTFEYLDYVAYNPTSGAVELAASQHTCHCEPSRDNVNDVSITILDGDGQYVTTLPSDAPIPPDDCDFVALRTATLNPSA